MSLFYSDDPVRDAERWIEAQERELARCPVCTRCGEHICQDETVYDDCGEPYCQECFDIKFVEDED